MLRLAFRRTPMVRVWHDAGVDSGERPGQRVDVAVVGTVNLDYTVRVPRLPDRGETVVGDELVVGPGGKGVNQAVAAARQGAATALIGCVGDDAAGRDLLAFLRAEPRLDLRGLACVSGATGTAFVTVDHQGGNTIVSTRGANARLDETHVHRHGREIADASVLLVQVGVPADAVRAALEIARSVGTITVLDPSPADDVTDELLQLADVCTPNEIEIERLTGVRASNAPSVEAAADVLCARGCASVVVTLGERGAYVAPGTGLRGSWVPPFAVEMVDATGAGDAFCGALAAALARRLSLADALVDAMAAGALATTKIGAAVALPTRAAVEAFRSGLGDT